MKAIFFSLCFHASISVFSQSITLSSGASSEVFIKKMGIGLDHSDGGVTPIRIGTSTASGGGWIQTHSNHPLFFSANAGAAFMSILPTGNVGIGTTSPVTKLTIIGNNFSPSFPSTTSTGIFRISISDFEGIDFGKMGSRDFAGWIQVGFNGIA